MSTIQEIFISSIDARELERLLADHADRDESGESAFDLSARLFDAQVVAHEALPHGTVCLRATVTYEELPARARRQVTLVPPQEADAGAGRISVLSPVGRALLGHSPGRVVDVALPSGRPQSLRVLDVSPPRASRRDEPAFA
jgi:regulator of nucleoside diphosphate kinase